MIKFCMVSQKTTTDKKKQKKHNLDEQERLEILNWTIFSEALPENSTSTRAGLYRNNGNPWPIFYDVSKRTIRTLLGT